MEGLILVMELRNYIPNYFIHYYTLHNPNE